MTEMQQLKLERDQAVTALKFILDSKKDLFTFFNALDAAKALLTKLDPNMFDEDDTVGAWWHQQEMDERWMREQLTEVPMKTSQMVQSKFLKKEDFPTPEVLTIKHVSLEEVGKGDTRWVLFFHEKTKGVVLNITKIRQLEMGFGDDTDHWIGKKIKVACDPTVMMGQQVVGGIKFTLPSSQAAKPAPAPAPAAPDEFADEIPF